MPPLGEQRYWDGSAWTERSTARTVPITVQSSRPEDVRRFLKLSAVLRARLVGLRDP
jgi:Protein of unknown function (DUF2510)